MILVDTSFLIALLDPRDALHARSKAWAARIDEPLLVTEHVLWELVNFASFSASLRAKAHVLLGAVRSGGAFEVVPASSSLFEQGLSLHAARPDKGWSLTDCISFVVMSDRGLTDALTGDHHFEQAGFRAVLRGA